MRSARACHRQVLDVWKIVHEMFETFSSPQLSPESMQKALTRIIRTHSFDREMTVLKAEQAELARAVELTLQSTRLVNPILFNIRPNKPELMVHRSNFCLMVRYQLLLPFPGMRACACGRGNGPHDVAHMVSCVRMKERAIRGRHKACQLAVERMLEACGRHGRNLKRERLERNQNLTYLTTSIW